MSRRGGKKPPLALDMDFSEALTRFAKVDADELPDNVRLKKKGARKPPSKLNSEPD